jgi:hypothetical protein
MKLKIDHFYLIVKKEAFGELLKNEQLMQFCEHKVVKADNGEASWEGLYLKSEEQVYFELVQEDLEMGLPDGAVGIAISQIADAEEEQTIRECLNSLSDVDWEESKRLREDGSPWFKSWYPKDYEQGFLFWLMSYQGAEVSKRKELKSDKVKSIATAKLKFNAKDYSKSLDRLGEILSVKEMDNGLLIQGADQNLELMLSSEFTGNELSLKTTSGDVVRVTLS